MNTTPLEIIRTAAAAALAAADHLVPDWLPEGSRKGAEWVAVNTARGDRQAGSFSINLTTGKWNDFADSDARGGDLVALLAYLHGSDQLTAARTICHALGIMPAANETPEQRERRQTRIAKQKAQRDKALQQAEEDAEKARQRVANEALERWQRARPANPNHPYLKAKRILPYRLRQDLHGNLLVPLHTDNELHNLQLINPKGEKRFLGAGRVSGCYSQIGARSPGQPIYICEGWATGATVHADTGCAVFCAMSAGNLKRVARHVRKKAGPDQEIILAADDDRATAGNPGREAAYMAAQEINGLVVLPQWPADAPANLTDFNDLHCWLAERAAP